MGDVFDQMRERRQSYDVGQSVVGMSCSVEPDAVVMASARSVHRSLEGLTFEQARAALYLAQSALELSAVVQCTGFAPASAATADGSPCPATALP